MKNLTKILATLLVAAPSLLLAQSGNFTVTGKVGVSSPSKKVYLENMEDPAYKTDSVLSVNGGFTFKGTVTEPTMYCIMVKGKQDDGTDGVWPYHCFTFFVSPGVTRIVSIDSIANAKITTGGLLNKEFFELKTLWQKTYSINKIHEEYVAAPIEKQKSKVYTDSLINLENIIFAKRDSAYLVFVKSHTNSYAGLYALNMYNGGHPFDDKVEPLFNLLSANIRSSTAGKTLADEIAESNAVGIGRPAPDFTMADTTGKMVSLHDFKGKYVLVDFWASWCAPCRAENPNVVKAYAQFKDKGFQILGVSLDNQKSKAAWEKAILTDNLTWTEISDLKGWENGAVKMYHVKGIPQNFLVGPDGKIAGRNLHGDDLENKLAEIYGKN